MLDSADWAVAMQSLIIENHYNVDISVANADVDLS